MTVHIVLRDGQIQEAFADGDVNVVVYDFDTSDSEMVKTLVNQLAEVEQTCDEVEIF